MGENLSEDLLRKYENIVFSGVSSSCTSVNGRYESPLKDLSLDDFLRVRKAFCERHHQSRSCEECRKLISAAHHLKEKGIVPLKDFFVNQFPVTGKYKTDKAVRRIMQIPTVIFPLELETTKTLYVAEQQKQVDYNRLQTFLGSLIMSDRARHAQSELTKETLKHLCELASSEKDKRLIKFAACTASSGMSAEQARKRYEVNNYKSLTSEVKDGLEKSDEIQKTVYKLATIEDKCFLEKLGILVSSDSSDSESDSDDTGGISDNIGEVSDKEEEGDPMDKPQATQEHPGPREHPGQQEHPDEIITEQQPYQIDSPIPSFHHLLLILRNVKLNWFAFVEELKLILHAHSSNVLNQALIDFAHHLPYSDVSEEEERLIEQSRQAFLMKERERESTGDIVSDSESDDPELYVDFDNANNLRDPKLRDLVNHKRKLLRKKARRRINKEMAERSLLRRKVPRKASKLLRKYPNLGKDIESFVRDNRVGADAWRRTGVATFDGYEKKGPRVTYKRIKEHLEKKYQTKFSYGAVVQLSVVRNKRRRSSCRYWGAANITCRKARKGSNIKLNVDAHWSAALYRGLDKIQLEDGRNKTIINRDDAAGYRLDTTYTHKQHKSISECGKPELTTRTDYVNKYSSIIQVTSYLLVGTKTIPQLSAGIVKPPMIYPKNPAQHMADMYMLQKNPEFECRMNGTLIDCVRVDGAGDEGPSHHEVQFLATERHLDLGKACTLITSRCNGSSYLTVLSYKMGVWQWPMLMYLFHQLFMGQTFTQTVVLTMRSSRKIWRQQQMYT